MSNQIRISVAALGGREPIAGWTSALRESWPGGSPPVVERYAPAVLASRLRNARPADEIVVVEVGPRSRLNELSGLLEALRKHSQPAALLVVDDADPSVVRRLERAAACDGMLVLGAGQTPADVAQRLAALLARQPLVTRLREELLLSSLGERRVSAELESVHEELSWAARMQRDLVLRHGAAMTPIDVGVLSRPATYVSGDLFDIEPLTDDVLSFFLADAVGHGVPAAMMTLFLSSALPKIDGLGDSARIVPPGEALARLNREFVRKAGQAGRFATGVYGTIDRRTLAVTIATAGHPPPIFVRSCGAIDRIDTGGPLLGVFSDEPFPERTFPMVEGEALVLYSDGFETAFDAPGERGRGDASVYEGRLTDLGRQSVGPGAVRAAIQSLEAELDQRTGSLHRDDDVTAMVVSIPRAGANGDERRHAA